MYNTYKYTSIHINTDHHMQYKPVHTICIIHADTVILICTFQYRPIPINMYNTYHVYNTNKYIQIHTNHSTQYINTYQYKQ